MIIEILKCHGTGNDFILIDLLGKTDADVDWGIATQKICARKTASPSGKHPRRVPH